MKALKIIGIAIAVLALIVGALLLKDYLGDGEPAQTFTPTRDTALFNDLKSIVTRDWSEATAWSQETYDRETSRLNQERPTLNDDFVTLSNYRNELVRQRLCNFLLQEFAKPACSAANIERDYAGLRYFLKENPMYSSDDSVRTVMASYDLYKRALAFIRKPIGVSPSFDLASNSWSPDFAAYRSGVEAERDAIRRNGHFKNIQNITTISQGLNAVSDRLDNAYTVYKIRLANQIKAVYDGVARTTENLKRLQIAEYQYANAFNSSALSSYVRYFKEQVN